MSFRRLVTLLNFKVNLNLNLKWLNSQQVLINKESASQNILDGISLFSPDLATLPLSLIFKKIKIFCYPLKCFNLIKSK